MLLGQLPNVRGRGMPGPLAGHLLSGYILLPPPLSNMALPSWKQLITTCSISQIALILNAAQGMW